MVDVPALKQRVVEFIRQSGPSLPITVGKILGSDSLFAGAILSELIAEKRVRVSAAKIGRSVVYYLPGQEDRLHVLYEHLPEKEKEAYRILREQKVVFNKDVDPATRVALRALRDFATLFVVDRGGGEEAAWRWHLMSEEEARSLVMPREVQVQQPTAPKVAERSVQQLLVSQVPAVKKEGSDFLAAVVSFAAQRGRVLEQQVVRKNQEVQCVLRVASGIGELDVLVIGRSKKRVDDSDLAVAHQRGVSKKMLVLFMTNGELTKKAQTYFEKNLKGYMFVQRL